MLFCGQFNRISRIGGTQNTVENWGGKDKIVEWGKHKWRAIGFSSLFSGRISECWQPNFPSHVPCSCCFAHRRRWRKTSLKILLWKASRYWHLDILREKLNWTQLWYSDANNWQVLSSSTELLNSFIKTCS